MDDYLSSHHHSVVGSRVLEDRSQSWSTPTPHALRQGDLSKGLEGSTQSHYAYHHDRNDPPVPQLQQACLPPPATIDWMALHLMEAKEGLLFNRLTSLNVPSTSSFPSIAYCGPTIPHSSSSSVGTLKLRMPARGILAEVAIGVSVTTLFIEKGGWLDPRVPESGYIAHRAVLDVNSYEESKRLKKGIAGNLPLEDRFGREIEIDAIPAIVQYELAFYRFRSKVVTEEFLKCAFEESLHGVQGPRPYDQFKEGTAMVEANRIISGESEDGYYPFHDQRYTRGTIEYELRSPLLTELIYNIFYSPRDSQKEKHISVGQMMNYAYGRYPEIFFDSSEASLPWRDFIPTSAISVAMTVLRNALGQICAKGAPISLVKYTNVFEEYQKLSLSAYWESRIEAFCYEQAKCMWSRLQADLVAASYAENNSHYEDKARALGELTLE